MKTLKTFESFLFESSEVELETNKLNQAKINDQIKKAEDTIKKTDADKNKKQSQKDIVRSNQMKQIAQFNANKAKLQQREAQLISTIAQQKSKM